MIENWDGDRLDRFAHMPLEMQYIPHRICVFQLYVLKQ